MLNKSNKDSKRISAFIENKDRVTRNIGDTLSMETRSSRMRVGKCLLMIGIKLEDSLSGLMELLDSSKLTVDSKRLWEVSLRFYLPIGG